MFWFMPPRIRSSASNGGSASLSEDHGLGQGRRDTIPSRLKDKEMDDLNHANKNIDYLIDKTSAKGMDDQTLSRSEQIRVSTQKYLASSWIGRVYTNFFLVLSVLSCVQYIYETYLREDKDRVIIQILRVTELSLAAMFWFDWSLSLFLADHRWEHFWSFFAMVDFATVVPIWVTYIFFPERIDYTEIMTFGDAVNYAMRGAATLRILRALRVHRKLNFIDDEVKRFLYSMLLSVVTMILFDSAIIRFLELHEQQYQFHTWMYYVVVSISTVGYGDISPLSALGRFAAMCIICFAIIFVPQQTNQLIEKMGVLSVYARRRYKPRANTKHVVICGDLRTTFLIEFFNELFHEDHENMNLNAVILQPDPPSSDMHEVLRDPLFGIFVHYLEGSPLNNFDLDRAKVKEAVAVFIMGNKFSVKPDEDDAKTILQQFSIKRYIESSEVQSPLYCLQLIRPENRRHLGSYEDENPNEIVVCLNEMKMGLLAKNCVFPGTSTLIFNLLTSFADNGNDDDDEINDRFRSNSKSIYQSSARQGAAKVVSDGDNVSDDSSVDSEKSNGGPFWMDEYQKGCDWEIYTTDMADVFEGAKFIDVASRLYSKLGVVLFALRVTDTQSVQARVRVVLNPADYIIPNQSRYRVQGFVIAKNQTSSDLSFQSGESVTNLMGSIQKVKLAGTNMIKRQSVSIRSDSGSQFMPKRASVIPGNASSGGSARGLHASGGWHTLLASHVDQKKEEEVYQTKQERIQMLEEEYMHANFFMRSVPASLGSCTVHSSLQDEYPFINDHMIVIAKGLSNLYDFIRPLRAKYLGKLRHIVLLFPFEIPVDVWRRISVFEGILYVRGSPLEESDIKRAGVFRASQVVVLADPDANSSLDSSGIDALIDADAIFTYHCVKRLNDQAHIVIEIVRHQNVGYLDISGGSMDVDYKFTPNFAAGTLFTSSMLDSVVCQVFYNPQIIRVLNKLISGTDHIETNDESHSDAKPVLLQQNSRNMIGMKALVGSSLYQVPIPLGFNKKTYGELFHHFATQDGLCIGLLRGVFSGLTVGPCANRMEYVFTNPSRDTRLFKNDRVFVLSQRVLTSSKSTAMEVMQQYMHANLKNGRFPRDSISESVTSETNLDDITFAQRSLEKAMANLSGDMAKRFDDMLAMKEEFRDLKESTYRMMTQFAGGQRNNDRKVGIPRHNFARTESSGTVHGPPTPSSESESMLRDSNFDEKI